VLILRIEALTAQWREFDRQARIWTVIEALKRMFGTLFAASFAEGLSWHRRNSRLRFVSTLTSWSG